MAKKGWSSIHSEVNEAKSMKTTVVVWVPKWNKTKKGKTLAALSLLFIIIIYIYIYLCIYEKRRLLNACMAENRMCLFA